MGSINAGRVVLGGLLAGLVIDASEYLLNGVVLSERMNAALQRLNLPSVGGPTTGVFVVLGFLLGIATTWLYAAIRPRFGAGVRTALCAGSTAWFFAHFYRSIIIGALGFLPASLLAFAVIWQFVELLVAALAGGWLYQEAPGRVSATV
jgi:hypothetical protein